MHPKDIYDRDDSVFCNNVRFLHQKCGYSRTRFAQIMHIAPATLDQIEDGSITRLRYRSIVFLAQHFNLQIRQLFKPLYSDTYIEK